MKRIIFLFVFSIMSLISFGQVDTLYLSKHNGSTSYHSTLGCPKVYEVISQIPVSQITSVHQLNKYFRCYECVSKDMINQIKETVGRNEYNMIFGKLGVRTYESEQPKQFRHEPNEYVTWKMQANSLNKAGDYLQKSAICQYTAVGLAGLGGFIGTIPCWHDFETNYNGTKSGATGCYVVAGVLGLGAFISEICAINYKFKAGSSLKISANHIQYNF